MHPALRALSMVPPFLTALLSFATICKVHTRLPAVVSSFFSPLGESYARYKVLQVRAHIEVCLGLVLVVGVFTVRAAPISALLYWNFMMMRYMMSPWTQASFRRLDGILDPFLGGVPLMGHSYRVLTKFLYSFVDPDSRKSGS